MEDLLVAKLGSMIILGSISIFFGLIPIKITEKFSLTQLDEKSKNTRAGLFVTALNCFGAGVILTTCFTHMLPETDGVIEFNKKQGKLGKPFKGVQLAEILVLVGFLMIYVVEELAHYMLDRLRRKPLKNEECCENPIKEVKKCSILNEPHEPHEDIAADIFITTPEKKSFRVAFRGFLIVLAISLHSVFEGMAMGLGGKASHIWYLCFAIAIHKFIIAFCVGLQMATSNIKRSLIVVYISTFALMTPLGIGMGVALTHHMVEIQGTTRTVEVAVLNGLAVGTLLYVVFFEILEKERSKKSNGLVQVSFITLGFIVMILVSLLDCCDHHLKVPELPCTIDPNTVFEQYSEFESLNVTCKNGYLDIES